MCLWMCVCVGMGIIDVCGYGYEVCVHVIVGVGARCMST